MNRMREKAVERIGNNFKAHKIMFNTLFVEYAGKALNDCMNRAWTDSKAVMECENPHIPIDPTSLDDYPALGRSLIGYMDRLFENLEVNPDYLDSSLSEEARVTIERYRSAERAALRQRSNWH
jgi:hypothetical protein